MSITLNAATKTLIAISDIVKKLTYRRMSMKHGDTQ